MSPAVEVALCPQPPLLVRALGGPRDPAAELRAACHAAVSGLLSTAPHRMVVVGPTEETAPVDGRALDVRRFGTTLPRTDPEGSLPLSLGIGRMLLDDCGWTGVTEFVGVDWDASEEDLHGVVDRLARDVGERSTGLLLLGDGSARRGETAPGFLDHRAFGYDDLVADALADGDAARLRKLDLGLGRELMVGGRSVFRLLGLLADGRPVTSDLDFRGDPFGVCYFVARWTIA